MRAVFKASGVVNAHAHRFRHTLATGISESVAEKHYAKWNQARQDRISALMNTIHSGTNRAHKKKLVVMR